MTQIELEERIDRMFLRAGIIAKFLGHRENKKGITVHSYPPNGTIPQNGLHVYLETRREGQAFITTGRIIYQGINVTERYVEKGVLKPRTEFLKFDAAEGTIEKLYNDIAINTVAEVYKRTTPAKTEE